MTKSLTAALSMYAATEKQQELQDGLQCISTEIPVLKDEKICADFEVYVKKFLMSLDIILPDAAALPYRVPAKRFGFMLCVTKERYKDASLILGDVQVKALINGH